MPTPPKMPTFHDQLAKQTFEEVLSPAGPTHSQREVSSAVQAIDLWFAGPEHPEKLSPLGLAGRLASGPTCFEFESSAPNSQVVRQCLTRHLRWHEQRCEQASGQVELARLWILAAGRPVQALSDFGLERREPWPPGVYRCPLVGLNLGLVIISELERSPGTLMLRLLGRGEVQRQALEELAALPQGEQPWSALRRVVGRLMLEVRLKPDPKTTEEEEFLVNAQKTFEQFEQEVHTRGLLQGLEQGLERGQLQDRRQVLIEIYESRFGQIPRDLQSRIEQTNARGLLQRWTSLFLKETAEQIEQHVLDSRS